jgi:hypothetical protein
MKVEITRRQLVREKNGQIFKLCEVAYLTIISMPYMMFKLVIWPIPAAKPEFCGMGPDSKTTFNEVRKWLAVRLEPLRPHN